MALTLAVVALALPASASAARPNLRVSSVSVPTSVERNESMRVGDTTLNRGGSAAPASSTAYFLSPDARKSASDERIGARRVDPLKRNRLDAGIKSFEIDAQPGTYRVIACADDRRRIRERSERDNCTTARRRLRVVAATPGPAETAPAPQEIAPDPTSTPTTATPPPASDPPPPPAAPTGLTAIALSESEISLSWAGTNATSYRIFRDTSNGGPYELVAEVTDNQHTDSGLTAFTTYFYVVVAVGTGGTGAPSNQASAQTDFPCADHTDPGPPGVDIGTLAGDANSSDTQSASLCREDTDWYTVSVAETSEAPKDLGMRVRLISQILGGGSLQQIQLCVWVDDVTSANFACRQGTDLFITATAADNQFGSDDSFDLVIRVRYLSPFTQSSFTLITDGNVACPAETTCLTAG